METALSRSPVRVDATYPTPQGLVPGNGSILAAVATASGVVPAVTGKPYAPMADHVRAAVGPVGVAVGDRPDTDGRFARALGFEWVLVLSGVTGADDLPVDPVLPAVEWPTITYAPTWEGEDDANNYTSVDGYGPRIIAAATRT